MRDLRGKVVLITGGAHGIGKETARAFAREGARLVLSDINQERLDETVGELTAEGHEVIGLQVDLRDREQVYGMVDEATERMGSLDVLVNNAGVVFARQIIDLNDREITDMMEVNLYAPIWSTKRALKYMIQKNSGHIVNIASAAGKTTNPYLSVYCATKFGVVGFTDAIHQELHRLGIGTTTVNPGWVSSGMFKGARPIPLITRWKPPAFIAGAIVDAVMKNRSEIHRPRFMWIGGLLRAILGPRLMARLWRLFKADRLFSRVEGYE